MTRAALYARYSSENQRDASIEDPFRLCRERAAREGWTVVETYSDRAISGASMVRAGIRALPADAQAGRFDMVLSEALDRLSRDQEDVAGVFRAASRKALAPQNRYLLGKGGRRRRLEIDADAMSDPEVPQRLPGRESPHGVRSRSPRPGSARAVRPSLRPERNSGDQCPLVSAPI